MFDHGGMGSGGEGAPALRVVTSVDPDAPEPAWSDDDVAWDLAGHAVAPADVADAPRPAPARPTRRRPGSLAEAAELARPVSLGLEHTLPLVEPLRPLVPGGALVRGTTVAVDGGPGVTSLALALTAGPSRAGSWAAVVGLGRLGLVAAVEAGVDPERLLLVDEPPPSAWGQVVAALVGAVDVVVVGPVGRVRAADARRLAARARERGSVLVAVGGDAVDGSPALGLDVDLRLSAVGGTWTGLGAGHGHLRARRLVVEAAGRRRAARPRRTSLWLPATGGGLRVAEGSVASSVDGDLDGAHPEVADLEVPAPEVEDVG